MPHHNDFHGEHGLHHTYPSSISTGISDTRLYGSNSGAVRLPPQQHFHLPQPQPVEIDFRPYSHQPSNSVGWDSTLSNYGYPESNHFRSNQVSVEGPTRSGTENPLLSWYTENDGPWIPKGTVPDIPIDHNHSRGQPLGFRSTGNTTPLETNRSRVANSSENGAIPLAYLHSDSGYGTRRSLENASVFSSEVFDRNQDCSSLSGQVSDIPSFGSLKALEQRPESEITESWAGSQPASTGNRTRNELLHCPTCGKDVKTKSELKKHDLRHKKPFTCKHDGCARKDGFSTSNDLERHVRSKHPCDLPSTPSKVHRCAFPQCKSQPKVWPRLDNFRCHIKRVHQLEGDQLESLVRRSEQHVRLRSSSSPNHTYPRDARFQEREQREFLQDLTILDKVPPGPHHSVEPDEVPDDLFHCSQPSKATMLSPPDHVSFRSNGSHRIGLLPEQPLRSNYLEVDNDANTIEPNHHHPSIKLQNSLVTESKEQNYGKIPIYSYSPLRESTHEISSTTNPASNDGPVGSKLAKSLSNMKELMERARNATAALLKSSSSYPSATNSNASPVHDCAEEMADIMKSLERIHQDTVELESKVPLHIKEYPTPEPSEATPNVPQPGAKSEKLVCLHCRKFTGRPCQMRKHMKRHERPYGCTFLNCHKAFGSKNDWKRHENSQHFQSETWRCDEEKTTHLTQTSNSTSICAKVFHRKESFKDHLIKEHRVSDLSIVKEKLETCRIGRNCQSRFWCGFCQELILLKKKGTDAWTERFNHIDDHFEGRKGLKKQKISEWLPLEEADDSDSHHHHQRKIVDDDDESESLSASSQEHSEVERSAAAGGGGLRFNPVAWDSQGCRKRQIEEGQSGRPLKTARRTTRVTENHVICCQCQRVNNPAVLVGCEFCEDNHPFCANCNEFEAYPFKKDCLL